MIPIIQRYLLLEILKSSFATTLILFIILMSNTLGKLLSDISEGKTPVDALFPVLLGQSVHVLSLLLPLGFFLGIVFAFGRLYKDHELVVLHACGFGYRALYSTLLWILIPVLALSLWLSVWLKADMQQRAIRLVDEKQSVYEFEQLKVGQFNASKNKNQVVFIQTMSDDKLEVQDIILSQRGIELDVLETAKSGRHVVDDESGDLFLEMGPGIRYEGQAGEPDYRVIEFEKHGILIEKKPEQVTSLVSSEKSLTQLLESNRLKDRVELRWRFTIPVTLLILALLAVPLSYIAPRQGRYGKIGYSILIFIVYFNLLGLTRSAAATGTIPLWLNFWWVHALFGVLTIILLMVRNRTTLFIWNNKNS